MCVKIFTFVKKKCCLFKVIFRNVLFPVFHPVIAVKLIYSRKNIPSISSFYLDTINNFVVTEINSSNCIDVVLSRGFFEVGGWAVDIYNNELPRNVYLVINGKILPVKKGFDRSDVLSVYNNKAFRKCGIKCRIPSRILRKGKQEIRIILVSANKQDIFVGKSGNLILNGVLKADSRSITPYRFNMYLRFYLEECEKYEKFINIILLMKILQFVSDILSHFSAKFNYYSGYRLFNCKGIKDYCLNKNLSFVSHFPAQPTNIYEPVYIDESIRSKVISVKQPEIYVASLKDVKVYSQSSIIITADGFSLFDMVNSPEIKRYNFADKAICLIDSGKAVVRYLPESPEQIDKGILLCGTACFNYFHWIFEFVSRLALINGDASLNDVPLLVDHKTMQISQMREALNFFSGNRQIIELYAHLQYNVKLLVVPSPMSWIPLNIKKADKIISSDTVISEQVVNFLRETAGRRLKRGQERNKIYISRATIKAGSRVLENEEEIVKTFVSFGFKIVYPDKMSFAEQYECFSGASVIAGATGAAFTNIVFAPSDCKIICLINTKIDFSVYSTIAGIIGQEMIFIDGEIDLSQSDIVNYQRSFSIKTDRIINCLQLLNIPMM